MTTNGEAINILRETIIAMEKELGIQPSGVYASVRARLDILEKRITNPNSSSPNVDNPFIIGSDGITISTGEGEPTELRLAGSLYLRTDGYESEGLYSYRADGQWHKIDTDSWTANGDLDGTYDNQTVIGIQGFPVNSLAPEIGYSLVWHEDGYYKPQFGFDPNGDLSGGILSQTVVGLQNNPISNTTPLNNDIYIFNNGSGEWEPEQLAVVFDPLHSSTYLNIRSNRKYIQSPINNTKTGIVNLGSDTTQLTVGVINDYSSILGGNKNVVRSTYSSITVGSTNIINSASDFSSIICGQLNTTNAIYNFIGDGYKNSTSGTYSSILNGFECTIDTSCNHSLILSGTNNTISFGSIYSSNVSGSENIIDGEYSTILNGKTVSLLSDNALLLRGKNSNLNANSDGSVILSGDSSQITGKYSLLMGFNNEITSSGDGYSTILNGKDNLIVSNYSLAFGNNNHLDTNSDYSITLGEQNYIDGEYSFSFGNNNQINNGYNIVFGGDNIIDGQGSTVFGYENEVNENFATIFGYQGKSKYENQLIHSARSLSSTVGGSQKSEVILDGIGENGGEFNLLIPATENNLILDNNKSYDISLRVLIVNEPGIDSVGCARFVHEILVHVNGSNVVVDNNTQIYSHSSGAPANVWSVSINSSSDELIISIPSSGNNTRRAIATLEWRELSRV